MLQLRFLRLLFLTFDCLCLRWCFDLYIYRYLVAILTLAAGSSQAPLPPCSLFVEFFLLLLLLVVMSFCLRLSVSAPHSVAPARWVYLLASGLPGSSLLPPRLPPCSVRRGYSWVLRLWLLLLAGSIGVRFPGLGFCQWSGHPCACCPGALRAVRGFLPSGLFPFCWLLSGGPGLQSFFSFSSAQISLSLSALLAPASRPWGCSWLAPVSVLVTFVARVVPRHLLVAYLLVSLRFCEVIFRFALSHLPGWVQLFCFPLAPFQSVLLVCPGRWLVFLALSSAFRQVIDRRLLSSLWFGWCFCYLPFGCTPDLSLAYWLFHRFFSRGSSLCVFLDSRLLYSLAG